MSKSLYGILGVSPDAETGDIRKAYRTKAQRLHPDKDTGDEDAFKELLQAYEVLMDETRRRYYDENGAIPEQDKGSFLTEAITIILHLIDSVDSVKSVNIIAAAIDIVTKAAHKVKGMRSAVEEQISERKEAASRLSCEASENILAQAIISDISKKEVELAKINALEEEGKMLLEYFRKYSYRAEVVVSPTVYTSPFEGIRRYR